MPVHCFCVELCLRRAAAGHHRPAAGVHRGRGLSVSDGDQQHPAGQRPHHRRQPCLLLDPAVERHPLEEAQRQSDGIPLRGRHHGSRRPEPGRLDGGRARADRPHRDRHLGALRPGLPRRPQSDQDQGLYSQRHRRAERARRELHGGRLRQGAAGEQCLRGRGLLPAQRQYDRADLALDRRLRLGRSDRRRGRRQLDRRRPAAGARTGISPSA